MLKSGFVVDTQDNYDELKQEFYVRSHVHHSMKSELPLNVFIAISNVSGYVKNAKCDCRASAIGRCCHVAALLLKLSDFSTENSNIVIKPSTSEPYTWNKGKKEPRNPRSCMKLNILRANENHLLSCMNGTQGPKIREVCQIN